MYNILERIVLGTGRAIEVLAVVLGITLVFINLLKLI